MEIPTSFNSFRSVPKTGVIYVMARAEELGFSYPDQDWINLGQGAPETGRFLGDFDRISQIAVDVSSSEYSPVAGNRLLREQVAQLYNQRYRKNKKSQYSYKNIAISAGGRVGLTRIAAALGNVNLGHFLPDYTAYEELFAAFMSFVPIPIVVEKDKGFRASSELLEKEVIARGLGAILMSNPCNPTGQVILGDELSRFTTIARDTGCVLIFDEFYSHYVYDHPSPVSAAVYVENVNSDPVVLVDGLTKNWRYPGLRLSWTVGPEEIIEKVASAGSFLDGGAAHPIQIAAIPLLEAKVADNHFKVIQDNFSRKRSFMMKRIQELGFVIHGEPNGSFYCFVSLENLPEPLRLGMDFFERMLEEKVIVVPGEFFDVNPGRRRQLFPSRLRGYVRLSFGPEMEKLERGLDRIEEVLRSY